MISAIGISVDVRTGTGPVWDHRQLRPVLAELDELGFTHAELSASSLGVIIGGKLQSSRLTVLREALHDRPLSLTLHSSWTSSGRLGNLVDTTSPAQRAGLEADLELTAAIGAEVLVYHAGMLRDPLGDDDALAAGMAAEREHLRALGDKAGEKGVLIAVENVNPTAGMVARRAYGLRLDVLADQVSTVDHPRVSVCLDTGHAFLAARYLGYDFLGAIREIAPLVGHVHLTDNLGRVGLGDADLNERYATGDGDLHLPPGWGDIPFAEVFSVPFPREPTIILEMRSHFADHYAEALETTRKLQRLSSTSTTEALNLERPG